VLVFQFLEEQPNEIFIFFSEYYDVGFDYPGNDIRNFSSNSARSCQLECQKEAACNFFSFGVSMKNCWLKTSGAIRNINSDRISGPKHILGK
jgi:PAN domain